MKDIKISKINPTVSVVIPTCNRAHFVGRAIQSVLDQTYRNFEILVVDDASNDNTEEIVKHFSDERISYIPHRENKGGSSARNTGIKAARGKFIGFLDDDDEWLPQKLECQINLFSRSQSMVGAVYTGNIMCNHKTRKVLKEIVPTKRGMILADLLFRNCVGSTSSILIKKECLARVGLFDENLPSCQDWDMWIRISRHYQIDFVDQTLFIHYVHENRISTNYEARTQGTKILIEKISEDIASKPKIISHHHFGNSKLFYLMDDRRRGKSELMKAVRLNPINARYFTYFIYSLLGLNPFKPLPIFKRIIKRSCLLTQLLDNTYD